MNDSHVNGRLIISFIHSYDNFRFFIFCFDEFILAALYIYNTSAWKMFNAWKPQIWFCFIPQMECDDISVEIRELNVNVAALNISRVYSVWMLCTSQMENLNIKISFWIALNVTFILTCFGKNRATRVCVRMSATQQIHGIFSNPCPNEWDSCRMSEIEFETQNIPCDNAKYEIDSLLKLFIVWSYTRLLCLNATAGIWRVC